MSTPVSTVFLEPLDALILRGNKLFGDPGSYGESLIPPWPSVAAGAIRSRMLADAAIDLAAFARGEAEHPELGTPSDPKAFVLRQFHLARRKDDTIERLLAPPADVSIVEDDHGKPSARRATPTALANGLKSSNPLPLHPVLAETTRAKPASGYWLTQHGFERYLHGELPQSEHLVKSSTLWSTDERVGVGLSVDTRSAENGKLFSTQAIALKADVGFLLSIHGATPPTSGLLRFGGDGHAVAVHQAKTQPLATDYANIIQSGKLKLALASPGLFTHGWLPNGARPDVRRTDGALRFDLHGVTGWLVCAAVPRAEVISGWDLARWEPKAAQRVAPTSSVYWLELDTSVHKASLEALFERGLWSHPPEDSIRRAEGFNRLWLGAW